MKRTTILINYGFVVKKDGTILAEGSGNGSIWFDYSNSEEYKANYEEASDSFTDKFFQSLKASPTLAEEKDFSASFTYFTCVHSLTEDL